jgi:TolB-like protein
MWKRNCLFLVVVCAVLFSLYSLPLAQEQKSFTDQLNEAWDTYYDARFETSLGLTEDLLTNSGLTVRDSIAVLELQSIIYHAMGETYMEKSRQCLQQIAGLGPCLYKMPRDFWPRDVATSWCKIAYQDSVLNCMAGSTDSGEATQIMTIAVWPFDNNSVTKYKEELGDAIGIMLAEIFQQDLAKVTSLNVIERIKLQYLIDELKLAKEGLVDEETALKAGRLLNAHVMLFGSFSQLDSRQAMMQVRAVNVETSEIMTSASAEDRPRLFKMEQELVQQLCDQLDIELSGDEKEEIKAGGSESMDASQAYALGLEHEEKYEYKEAYKKFSLACELDPDFEEAKVKRDVYKPLAL